MIAPNGLRAKLAVHPIATPPTRKGREKERKLRGKEKKGGEKISEEERGEQRIGKRERKGKRKG